MRSASPIKGLISGALRLGSLGALPKHNEHNLSGWESASRNRPPPWCDGFLPPCKVELCVRADDTKFAQSLLGIRTAIVFIAAYVYWRYLPQPHAF
jgi:hypothetical protein